MRATLLATLTLLALGLTACGTAQGRPQTLSPATRVADKTQFVDARGIQLAVPAAWKLNQQQCGTPTANTVVWLTGGIALCAVPRKPGLSVVEFGGYWDPHHAKRVTIDGAEALRWNTGNAAGLKFPRRGLTVTIESPHRALVQQILTSARVIQANKLGCASEAPSGGYRLGSRRHPGQRFVPVGAIRLVGCYYQGHWLDDSSHAGSRAARKVGRLLSNAPHGFSHAPGGSIAQSECAPSWGAFSVAYFTYANRSPVAVTVHPDGCTRLGASNGKWAVQMSYAWVPTWWNNVAYDGSIADKWGCGC